MFCFVCCEDKNENLFYVAATNARGRSLWCKTCQLARWHQLDKEKHYYQRWKDKLRGKAVPKLERPTYTLAKPEKPSYIPPLPPPSFTISLD